MEKLTQILAVALEPASATRVLDKAVVLARCFGARVEALVQDPVVAHVLNARCAGEGYADVTVYSIPPSKEAENEIILRRAWSSRPDLIIKPPAHPGPGSNSFDASDWELADQCAAPVLLARRASWERPIRFAAAVDVSDADNAAQARSILHTAGFLALGTHGNLDILYSEREARDEALRMERAVRLAQMVREFHVGCERLQMFSGEPEVRLPPLVAARHYDVLVLGGAVPRPGQERDEPYRLGLMIDATDSDAVLVKAPSTQAAFASGAFSGRDQRANQG